ncbi:structural protein [Flavobacterium phage vB_FspS_mumin9-3]|uniref:Structural protein n=4 Tax=Muminvirus mumin TaxID=2844293 RepID=A0A6B9LMZ2_9CAUD|nr:virion structural protein [Flavobacterium phage vB_FspS_mumin9-1]QHB39665.1 structural protein [Flavobacterium phage vB_FspS_mumin6-1]QHB39732.1 structural protein [Flavobacterium phage vB_FspS_mumin6-2]QHB39931.1 structural protein [Flavobacterium phage vB_FspS_mumin9-1]QHB40065.1 structural protein [Flavobacterium phage vB_FspS_mumin9-3]
MTNVIDILVSKQAQAELDKVIASLKVTHEEIIKINQQGLKINSGASPKNPQQMNSSVKESIALNEKLEATNKKMLVTSKQLEQASLRESNARNALNKQRETTLNQLAKEEAKLAIAGNYYNKLQAELNNLSFAYKDLAARQQMGASLSKVEAERMQYLENRIKTLDKTLKGVDGAMGKYTRNVGNYSGSFNPLNNSIAQLGREMPAFANSVQTGFMAISNNLPIFFDAMENVIKQNKQLQAEGKPTKSALTQLAGALFSFQTLLSVGVTLLTLYGKEIVTWASSLFGANEVLEELNKNQKEFNDSKVQGRKDSISDRTELEKYIRTMRNSNLSLEERDIALKKIRSQFPFYFKNLTDEHLLNGNITKELASLNIALERRAVLQKATDANVKNKQRLVDLQIERDSLKSNLELEQKIYEQNKKINQQSQTGTGINKNMSAEANLLQIKNKILDTEKNINAFQTAIINNNKTINELKAKTIGLEYQENEAKKESIKLKKEEAEADKFSKTWFEQTIAAFQKEADAMSYANPMRQQMIGQIKLLTLSYQALYGEQKKQEKVQDPKFGTLEYYEKLKSLLQQQQKTIATTNPEWEHYNNLIKAVQIDIDILTGKQKELNETFFDSQKYFQGFVDSFTSQSGFGEVFKVMDLLNQNFETVEEKAKVVGLAVSEAFQEAFNTISSYSDANYQTMFSNLERQRDVSILFAGESTTAREEIERVYEERRKRIQRQQAESQKRLAMFNIATNTAQAVMATYAKLGFPAGIPLAIAVGAIGAVQLALTAAQPIPQFYKGTQNAPEGLAWTDEKGAELHTDSKGNIKDYGSNKGARLKKLDKGDKIYTASQTKKMMDLYGFNQDFNNIMLTNGISTSNFNNNSVNLEPLNARLDRLTNVVANKSEFTMVNNESGTKYYERVNGQRRELVNSVLTMKSRTIK